LPCPDDLFSDPKGTPMFNPLAPAPTPLPRTTPPPPVPGIDAGLPPAPPPAADPSTSVIRDADVNPVAARLKYTEDDHAKVELAKGEGKPRASFFGRKPKKPAPAAAPE
jgi:hypothetical protein